MRVGGGKVLSLSMVIGGIDGRIYDVGGLIGELGMACWIFG